MFDELNRQKQVYERGIILGFIITIAAFVLFIPVMMGVGPVGFILIAPPFLGGVIYAGKQGAKIKNMSNEFKEKYLLTELEKIIPGSRYRMFDGFTEKEVVHTGLLHNQDRFYSEDLIEGSYNDIRFKTSDVKQEDVDRKDGKTRVHTVFHGRFYEFEFNKNFVSNVLVGQPSIFDFFVSYKKVNLESIEFNSNLSVFSDNAHEVFYILTPQLMERILYLDRKYNDRIKFSFLDNKLYIAIDGLGDSFDIKAFKPIDKRIFLEYKQEFQDMTEFIDVLQLNKNIFKGE